MVTFLEDVEVTLMWLLNVRGFVPNFLPATRNLHHDETVVIVVASSIHLCVPLL